MDNVYETIEHAGCTINLCYDEYGYDLNPRENSDTPSIMAFDVSGYDLSDKGAPSLGMIDTYHSSPDFEIGCPRCEGSGEDPERFELLRKYPYGYVKVGAGTESAMRSEANRLNRKPVDGTIYTVDPAECSQCGASGYVDSDFYQFMAVTHDAYVALPLRFEDYGSSGSRIYECDYDPTDANGAIWVTRETVDHEWSGDRQKAADYMRAEVKEYGQWSSGEIYLYNVVNSEGDTVGGCGGFIGSDDETQKYMIETAKEEAEGYAEEVAKEARERQYWAERDVETIA